MEYAPMLRGLHHRTFARRIILIALAMLVGLTAPVSSTMAVQAQTGSPSALWCASDPGQTPSAATRDLRQWLAEIRPDLFPENKQAPHCDCPLCHLVAAQEPPLRNGLTGPVRWHTLDTAPAARLEPASASAAGPPLGLRAPPHH